MGQHETDVVRRVRAARSTGLALGTAVVLTAVVAGLILTFSLAVMPNQAGLDDRTFIDVAQRYNANPVFASSFALALLAIVVAVALAVVSGGGATVRWAVLGLVLFVVVFAITGAVHVPLNEAIDRAGDPTTLDDPARVRADFESAWVSGNVARSVAVVASLAALVRAVLLHGQRSGAADRG